MKYFYQEAAFMNVLGIIAEYNPFHNGHALQLEACKEKSGADYVVVVMSGNFTQRGEAAAADKFVRTKMALSCGADAVIELPVHAACASAGYFAASGVSLLKSSGIITHLGFGSESGDIARLEQASLCLSNESEAFKKSLNSAQKDGLSYALARQKALETVFCGAPDILTPNNILAIEYINAIHTQKASIVPVTIKRQVTGYHELSMENTVCSASALRHAARDVSDFSKYMPEAAAALFSDTLQKNAFVTNNDFSDMLYYALMSADEYTHILDIDDRLSNRIRRLKNDFTSFDDFCARLKSRNYTMTRICRAMYHLILGITDESFNTFLNTGSAPYIRLLGFKKTARPLLRALKENAGIPVITKAADAPKLLDTAAMKIFSENLFADNMYRYIKMRLSSQPVPHEFSRGLIIL